MRRPSRLLLPESRAEWGLSAILVCLVLTLFVGAPLAVSGRAGQYVFDAMFSLVLLSGLITAPRGGLIQYGMGALTFVALVVRWTRHGLPTVDATIWGDLFAIATLLIFVALVLVQVFRAGPITSHRIQGAIVAYLLLGLIWTFVYGMIYHLVPGAFRFPEGVTTPGPAHGLVYYSFVTLTTVGYGDITPVHPLARSVSMAEALVGQLYPAILIARLVSLELTSRRRD